MNAGIESRYMIILLKDVLSDFFNL